MRRKILDAARDLFIAQGYANVSMRKIADRIEYSPAAIYSYFKGKDDLFFALAEEGFQLLGRRADALTAATDPLDALRRVFWHYYEFSTRHPEYFALMFVERSVPRISREYERFAFVRSMKEQVAALIGRCVESGIFPRSLNPLVAFQILSSSVYGVSVMRLSDRLGSREGADALARDVIETVIAGLRAGVVTTSPAQPCAPAPADSDVPDSPAVPDAAEPSSGPSSKRDS